MDWKKVKEVPKYNPFQFQLAREVRGLTRHELAKITGLPLSTISKIERGDRPPTESELEILCAAHSLNFPASFFQQWHETEIDLSGPLAKNVAIDYYKYKIFRDRNPPKMTIV